MSEWIFSSNQLTVSRPYLLINYEAEIEHQALVRF